MGIAGALLLVATSVVLAGQGLLPGAEPSPSRGPSGAADGGSPPATFATLTPGEPEGLPAAPELEPPAEALTDATEIALEGRLVEPLPRDGRYRLRVYVNGERVLNRRLPRRQRFTLGSVPLSEGSNSISAAVSGPIGESLHSAPVVVERDSTAPALTVDGPEPGVVYADSVVLSGTSEAGAELRFSNSADGSTADLVLDDGRFELTVPLVVGRNELSLAVSDALGNTRRATIALERREGSPSVSLAVSRQSIPLEALPAALSLHARVLDAAGQPVDGAEVTLSISPPGLPTLTYVALTSSGVVTWSDVPIGREGAQRGQGLVTVMAVLPTGETVRESTFFSID